MLSFEFQLKPSSNGTAGHLLDIDSCVAGNNINSCSMLVFPIYHLVNRNFETFEKCLRLTERYANYAQITCANGASAILKNNALRVTLLSL